MRRIARILIGAGVCVALPGLGAAQRVPTGLSQGSVVALPITSAIEWRAPLESPGAAPGRPERPGRAFGAAAPAALVRAGGSLVRAVLGPAHGGAYRASDWALAGGFVGLLWVDAAQTRRIARDGWVGFRETNPFLGRHPSVARIDAYTVAAGAVTLGAAARVSPRVRPWLLGAAFLVEALTVAQTSRQGVPIAVR